MASATPQSQMDLFPSSVTPEVQPAAQDEATRRLGERLPVEVRLGTSSWSFPGWAGIVFDRERPEGVLARSGLSAYAQHPVLRTVGIDRTFWAPLAADAYASYAAAVPEGFRFLVKAHEECTLARFPVHARYGNRRGQLNPRFLDVAYARDFVVQPFVEGLSEKAGPLVFQFPPQEVSLFGGPDRFAERLYRFLNALPKGPLYAVELRSPELYFPRMGKALEAAGAVPVLARWGRLPSLQEQARLLGALERPALVVRWMLPPDIDYEEARSRYRPFNRLVDERPEVREEIARLCAEAHAAGKAAYVTFNNKAEGSAPLSAVKVAAAVVSSLEANGRLG